MNKEEFEGKWNQVKGSFREKWGDLTDDQIEVAAGKKDQLVGLLQENYGMSKEKAEIAFDNWMKRSDGEDKLEAVWHTVQGKWTEMLGYFKEEYGKTVDDDLTESKGRRDVLAGLVQREYNVSRGEAYEMVDDWAYGSYKGREI